MMYQSLEEITNSRDAKMEIDKGREEKLDSNSDTAFGKIPI